jgi:hypothetical protein
MALIGAGADLDTKQDRKETHTSPAMIVIPGHVPRPSAILRRSAIESASLHSRWRTAPQRRVRGVEKLILSGHRAQHRTSIFEVRKGRRWGNDPATMRWYPLAHSCSASI